jgi:hypothetical protein
MWKKVSSIPKKHVTLRRQKADIHFDEIFDNNSFMG